MLMEKNKKKTTEQSRVREGSLMDMCGVYGRKDFWKRYVLSF